jgi:cell division protein FtsL
VLVVFVIALTVLAVGRVALSFAVVQKTIATESIATEQRRLSAENARLVADVTRLTSMTRVRTIALQRLDLVPSGRVVYLTAPAAKPVSGERDR